MPVFHFPVFREKTELLETKTKQNPTRPNKTKKHKKLWLAGRQEMNLESINTIFLLVMHLNFVKHVGNLPSFSPSKAYFVKCSPNTK